MSVDSNTADQKKILDLQSELTMAKSQIQTIEHQKIQAQNSADFYMKEHKAV